MKHIWNEMSYRQFESLSQHDRLSFEYENEEKDEVEEFNIVEFLRIKVK